MEKIVLYLRKLATLPVYIYKWTISPVLNAMFGPSCRHEPSCSTYMVEAIMEWGIFRGGWMGIKRIAKCNPWGTFGPDPVPKKEKKA